MTNYSLSTDSRGPNLVVIYENGSDPVPVPPTHPRFDKILALLRSGEATDEKIEEMVDIMGMLGKRLTEITDRVSVTPYAVFVDGDTMNENVADVIVQAFSEGDETTLQSVANFLEKCFENPSLESVDSLYEWLKHKSLALMPNGNFTAYKAVLIDEDNRFVSITRGTAFVDGVEYTGHIPNDVGAVVTMPRSSVNGDGSIGCSTGLHAGTYEYARDFGSCRDSWGMLLVEINPRDVVSVPKDNQYAKLRVSKYKVLEHIENKRESILYAESEDAIDDTQPEMGGEEHITDGDFKADTPVGESEEDKVEKEVLEKTEEKKHGALKSIANFFKGS